ncbi:hypothetical protein ACWDSJ_37290 [Nocardia sp. NPDC003482]
MRSAYAEAATALRCLLNRYPHLCLTAPVKTLRWRRGIFFRRLESLAVHLGSGLLVTCGVPISLSVFDVEGAARHAEDLDTPTIRPLERK